MPDFKIRSASEADAPLILEFIRALAEYERLADAVMATEESIRRTVFGNPRFAEVVIGEEDGQPVAFALFFHNYSTFMGRPGLYLEDLFVQPAARGRGYGKALLAHLAAIALERDCGRFEWAVLDWNEPAIGFYESLGAVPVDDWTIFRVTGTALTKLAALARAGSNP